MPRAKYEHERRGTTHQVGVHTDVGIKNRLDAEIGASLLGRHRRTKPARSITSTIAPSTSAAHLTDRQTRPSIN